MIFDVEFFSPYIILYDWFRNCYSHHLIIFSHEQNRHNKMIYWIFVWLNIFIVCHVTKYATETSMKSSFYRFKVLYNSCQQYWSFRIFLCSFSWKFENHFVIVPTFNSQDHSKWQQSFKRHKMHWLLYGNEWRAFGVCGLVSIDAILHRRIIDIYFVVFCFIYTSRR